mgnify:CR=1 FL=1
MFYNLGYYLFGLLVVASEFSFFTQNQAPIHLATAVLWLIQISMAIINKIHDDDDSKLAKSAAVKIYFCLSLINLLGIYIIRVADVPDAAQ